MITDTVYMYQRTLDLKNIIASLRKKFWKPLVKFRNTNSPQPVDGMEFPYMIEIVYCDSDKLADKFHFILECKSLSTLRTQFLPSRYCHKYYEIKRTVDDIKPKNIEKT